MTRGTNLADLLTDLEAMQSRIIERYTHPLGNLPVLGDILENPAHHRAEAQLRAITRIHDEEISFEEAKHQITRWAVQVRQWCDEAWGVTLTVAEANERQIALDGGSAIQVATASGSGSVAMALAIADHHHRHVLERMETHRDRARAEAEDWLRRYRIWATRFGAIDAEAQGPQLDRFGQRIE